MNDGMSIHGFIPSTVYSSWGGMGLLSRRSEGSPSQAAATTTRVAWPICNGYSREMGQTGPIHHKETLKGVSGTGIPPMVYQSKEQDAPLGEVLKKAGKRALGGGIPGAAAMGIQVASLMWLRTTVNYQYRYGMTTGQALKILYKEGGVRRFYRGVGPALLQGPLSRFGDTAANAGVLALMESSESTRNLPVGVKTLAASASAGVFRIFLMPVDALKTILQVEGKNGLPALKSKVKANGPGVLYHGALAASAATFAGHYPWFATYNYLNGYLPVYEELPKKLMRAAFIGFCASAISDTVSNSIRVVKTTKQTATTPMTYPQVVRSVVATDGVLGLMGRGLKTKILSNGLQGLLFSVLWRLGQDYYNKAQ